MEVQPPFFIVRVYHHPKGSTIFYMVVDFQVIVVKVIPPPKQLTKQGSPQKTFFHLPTIEKISGGELLVSGRVVTSSFL